MAAPGPQTGTIKQAAAGLRRAGELVEEHGLRIALEFNTTHPVINGLEVAREVIALAKQPSAGLLLDAYHMERTGSGGRGFEDVAPEEIFAFQLSDGPHGPQS